MAKQFKTVDELVEILKSRGVEVDDDTGAAIERESYYAIVNGYKDPFLDREAMESSADDVYLEGTRFEWMYDLFQFDRDLRLITFNYLTQAEAVMRTSVAYAFCEAHQSQDAYLDRSNFCTSDNYLLPRAFKGNRRSLHSDNLNRLMKVLNDKLAVNRYSRDFIKHYMARHGGVPLWVLANDLTFGNIVNFYQLMQPEDRMRACTLISKVSRRSQKEQGFLSERKLLRSATILKDFRNYCAHDERLYCAKSGDADFSVMTLKLFDLLPAEDVVRFMNELADLYGSYKNRLHNMDLQDLLCEMGFPRIEEKDDTEYKGIESRQE